jgi:hypothetical protein
MDHPHRSEGKKYMIRSDDMNFYTHAVDPVGKGKSISRIRDRMCSCLRFFLHLFDGYTR